MEQVGAFKSPILQTVIKSFRGHKRECVFRVDQTQNNKKFLFKIIVWKPYLCLRVENAHVLDMKYENGK